MSTVDDSAEEGEDQDMQAPPERGRPAIPNPPPDNERSPFEMDRPNNGGAAPGANPPARRAPDAGNAPHAAGGLAIRDSRG